MADEKKAAFGVFPQMKPRRSRQDPEAAKNVPVDVARGFVSGALGQLGDLEALVRMLPGFDEKTLLPTSEEIEARLPLRSDTPVSRAMTGAGQLAGSFYGGPGSSVRAAFGLPRAVKRAAQDFMQSAGQTVSPLTVFHGSPHKFTKFDASKIGTGEGAQAYGHGLYFAENPGIASGYAKTLANRDIKNQNRLNAHANAQRLAQLAGDPKFAADDIRFALETQPDNPQRPLLEDTLRLLESGEYAKPLSSTGNLYKVDLPDEDIARMLDWDKPLSQQPEVQKVLKGTDYEVGISEKEAEKIADMRLRQEAADWADETGGDPVDYINNANWEQYVEQARKESGSVDSAITGKELHDMIMRDSGYRPDLFDQYNYQVDTSETLRQLGIPGIKYLDATSRDAGKGTQNFVVFPGEEGRLTILERNPEGMKRGGKVSFTDNLDTMRLELAGGGVPKAIAQRLKALRGEAAERAAAVEAIQARDRKLPLEQIPEGSMTPEAIEAEIKRMREEKGMAAGGAAKVLKALAKGAKEEEKAAMKASEALGQREGHPLLITQSDRSKVGGKWLGGSGFSGLQHTRPEYKAAEAAWGVGQPATAKTIVGGYEKAKKQYGKEPVMTTMLGTPTQHQSNKMVFEELHRLFKKSAKEGNLDPELYAKINNRLRMAEDKNGNLIFPEDVDILSPDFRKIANTFDRRAVASNLMGGMTVGGKKGQIIDYDEVIRHTTDPALLDAPTGALGNRMFTLSGGIVERPDLHPAFPTILQGEDLGLTFAPVPREEVMRDFIERTMREKGRTPGYMDYTRGHPPVQLITEELLTDLQKKGYAEGGAVSDISGDDLIIEERPL